MHPRLVGLSATARSRWIFNLVSHDLHHSRHTVSCRNAQTQKYHFIVHPRTRTDIGALMAKLKTRQGTVWSPGFLSLCKDSEEPLPGLFPQTPVPRYTWPCRTQVADKVVSPSCFRSSLSSCPLSWCPLCHSFSPSVVVESCNMSRPSVYSLLDNVDDVMYTCLMSYPGITFVVT